MRIKLYEGFFDKNQNDPNNYSTTRISFVFEFPFKWIVEYNHFEEESNNPFVACANMLIRLRDFARKQDRINRELKDEIFRLNNPGIKPYNPNFGDERICECGHTYYRHFDTYEDMYPCGCKYCDCREFKEKV